MAPIQEVRVHPTVLFSIVDSYERRNADCVRVIGTLLGTVDKSGYEVTNCFCVPHNESESEVAIDLEFAKTMYELHRKVNPNEVVIGWWSTGCDISEHSVLIHDYYARECKNPVHLTVDTTLRNGKMAIKAYTSTSMGVPDKTIGTMFTPMTVKYKAYEPEQVGVDFINLGRYNPKRTVSFVSDLSRVVVTCNRMKDMVSTVIKYVDGVMEGHIPADNIVGRQLLDLCNAVPKIEPEKFEEVFNSGVKDLLMVVFLGQLIKTQLHVKEKLNLL